MKRILIILIVVGTVLYGCDTKQQFVITESARIESDSTFIIDIDTNKYDNMIALLSNHKKVDIDTVNIIGFESRSLLLNFGILGDSVVSIKKIANASIDAMFKPKVPSSCDNCKYILPKGTKNFKLSFGGVEVPFKSNLVVKIAKFDLSNSAANTVTSFFSVYNTAMFNQCINNCAFIDKLPSTLTVDEFLRILQETKSRERLFLDAISTMYIASVSNDEKKIVETATDAILKVGK
jgi:hypothetical protein